MRHWISTGKRLAICLPVLLVLGIFGGLIGRAQYMSNQITAKYRLEARQAVASKDMQKAKFYYSRLVGDGDQGSSQDQLNWVRILAESGDQQAATSKLDDLAPDDKVGFGLAHREKAKMLMNVVDLQPNANQQTLELLGWHMKHGVRESSLESDLLWAKYHLKLGQIDQGIDRLVSAATEQPKLWPQIAALYNRLGRLDEAERAYRRTEAIARAAVDQNPLDVESRLLLCESLAKLGRQQELDGVLEEGLRVTGANPAIKRAASNRALMLSQRIDAEANNADLMRLELVSKAAKLDVNNPAIYSVLAEQYLIARSDEARAKYREQLQDWIADGVSVPDCHFALGNLLFGEGDREGALFHLEAALQMDQRFTVVANNLAWILSVAEQPEQRDLPRAEQLIKMCLESDPDRIQFRDTYAAVLFAKEDWKAALPEFEAVLQYANAEKKKSLHEKLAIVYEKLGRDSLAQTHRELAKTPAQSR